VRDHLHAVTLGKIVDNLRVLVGCEERDQARELRPPSQGAEDVAPPSEDDPANDGTCRPVQAVELRPTERVDAALARLLGDAVVDPRRRPIGPGDGS